MSVLRSLDPKDHIKLAEALRPLRKDNILIVGSDLSFHGGRAFRGDSHTANAASVPFHEYLTESLVTIKDPEERRRRLARWASDAPHARLVHPREEHSLPLHVIAGAGLDEPCEEIFADYAMHVRAAGFLFGKRT